MIGAVQKRLPPKRDVWLVFGLCVTLIYSWSVLMFFNYLPTWLMYLDSWSVLGIFSYGQFVALLESALLLGFLLLLSIVLPADVLRNRFATQGSLMVLIAAVGAMAAHLTKIVPLWPSKKLLLAIALYVAAVAFSYWLLRGSQRFATQVEALVDRLSVFLFLYLPLGILGSVIVIVRNLTELL